MTLNLALKLFIVMNFRQKGIDKIVKRIRDRVGNNPLYLSIDIDVLDPSHAPGTGYTGNCWYDHA